MAKDKRCTKDAPGPGHRWSVKRSGRQITRTCTDCGRVEHFVPDGSGGVAEFKGDILTGDDIIHQQLSQSVPVVSQSNWPEGGFLTPAQWTGVVGWGKARPVNSIYDDKRREALSREQPSITMNDLDREAADAFRTFVRAVAGGFTIPASVLSADAGPTNSTPNSPKQLDAAESQRARLPYDPQNSREIDLDD